MTHNTLLEAWSRHSRFWHSWFCYHLATVLHLWSAAVRRCRRWTDFTSQLHVWRTTGQCDRSISVRHAHLASPQRGRSSLARVVCQAPRSSSSTKLRQQLQWLLFRQQINYKLSVITYRTRSTGNPANLHRLIHDYLPARTLRSSDKLLLILYLGWRKRSALALLLSRTRCRITVDPRNFSAL